MKKKQYWNYRVIKMADPKLKGLPRTYSYGIYEVHYENDIPTSWSKNPIHPIGEDWNGLNEDYHYMFQAFTKKTLELKGGKLIEGKLFR